MPDAVKLGLLVHFLDLPDPRTNTHLIRHHLFEIVAITLLGTLAGADDWVGIEDWADARKDWLDTFLDLPGGIPSHDTLARVFSMLQPKALQDALLEWTRDLAGAIPGVVALDGKTIRRSMDRASGAPPVHLLSAFHSTVGLSLAQMRVDAKSNEIPAFPELLALLDIRGNVVTADAMGCQKDVAAAARNGGGDFLLALKENQPSAHAEAVELLSSPPPSPPVVTAETREKDHGRFEIRRIAGTPLAEGLPALAEFRGARSVWRVERRTEVDGKVREEAAYWLSSLAAERSADAARALASIRWHWAIENRCHWVLDVAMGEDANRTRLGHAAENLALVRKLAMNLVRLDTARKRGVKASLRRAGWDNEYLLHLLSLA